jgi:hypothetical protein
MLCFSPLRLRILWPLLVVAIPIALAAVAKPHVIAFGKSVTVQLLPDSYATPASERPSALKIRPLLIDGRVKEFTLGNSHDVTDRLFVVRRAFRLNDSLPQDSTTPHWQWQRGGWLLVDRLTGRISTANLPDFDAGYSAASWYRDYAAYCGISDDGKKVYAIVAQISRRKPLLKKPLEEPPKAENIPATGETFFVCSEPTWQRAPARVTFDLAGGSKETFAIRGHMVDLVNDNEEEEDEESSR